MKGFKKSSMYRKGLEHLAIGTLLTNKHTTMEDFARVAKEFGTKTSMHIAASWEKHTPSCLHSSKPINDASNSARAMHSKVHVAECPAELSEALSKIFGNVNAKPDVGRCDKPSNEAQYVVYRNGFEVHVGARIAVDTDADDSDPQYEFDMLSTGYAGGKRIMKTSELRALSDNNPDTVTLVFLNQEIADVLVQAFDVKVTDPLWALFRQGESPVAPSAE